jgi:uncharacterized membrane protein
VILSKRMICYVLGFLWLLDGALQLQSFMFTPGFAHQIIAPAAAGQPFFVSAPINWNARIIAEHPALVNGFFASVQLVLGLAFLAKRMLRQAIVASIIWSTGVWYLGEGLGGLAGGHVTALLGAPGAAVLYSVLALAAWPERSGSASATMPPGRDRPPRWALSAWGFLWLGYAVLNLLPGNIHPTALSEQLAENASSVPSWLAGIDRTLGSAFASAGAGAVALTVVVELAIGLLAFSSSRLRLPAVCAGIALAGLYWAVGQSFGQLLGGQATDPSTGPLVIVLGLAAIGAMRRNDLVSATGLRTTTALAAVA